MGRVNKKKMAEYADSAENGIKKQKLNIESDTDDDPLTKSLERATSASAAAFVESLSVPPTTTSLLPRKRKSSVVALSCTGSVDADGGTKINNDDYSESDYDNDEDDNKPLNGKDVKKLRTSNMKANNNSSNSSTSKGKTSSSSLKTKVLLGEQHGKKQNKGKNSKCIGGNNDHNNDCTDDDNIDDDVAVNDSENGENDDNDDDNEEEYEVEKIVDHKIVEGVNNYLVRWKGYSVDADTWEPEATLSCPDLIAEFKQNNSSSFKHSNKKGSTVGGGKNKNNDKSLGARRRDTKGIDNDNTDPNKEWEVEKIIDCTDAIDGRLFRIRWKGFKPKDDTWEPEQNLKCNDLIEKFVKRMASLKNYGTKNLREDPKKTKRLVNETTPRTNYHNKIERSSKRSVTKQRVFYGEE